MSNGCPTVRWISLLVVAAFLSGLSLQRTTVQAAFHADKKMSPDLFRATRVANRNERIRVIIQFKGNANEAVSAEIERQGGRIKSKLANLETQVVELSAGAIETLAERSEVAFIAPDRTNISFGHISATSGADAARATNATNTNGLDGTGIGIAVLVSGIDTNHKSFLDRSNNLRVIASRDFTGEGRTDDPYG